MTKYSVTFIDKDNTGVIELEAEDKSNAIEVVWDKLGNMINIREITEIGN